MFAGYRCRTRQATFYAICYRRVSTQPKGIRAIPFDDSETSDKLHSRVLRLAKKRFPRAAVKAQLVKSIYWPAWAMNAVLYAEHSQPREQNVWTLSSIVYPGSKLYDMCRIPLRISSNISDILDAPQFEEFLRPDDKIIECIPYDLHPAPAVLVTSPDPKDESPFRRDKTSVEAYFTYPFLIPFHIFELCVEEKTLTRNLRYAMVADGRKDHYSLGAVASPSYEPEHSTSTKFIEPDQIIFTPISFHSSRISSMVQSPNQFDNISAMGVLQTLTSRPSTVSPMSYVARAAVIKWLRGNRSKIDFASAPKWTEASAKHLPFRSPSQLQLHKEYLTSQVEITTVKHLIEYLRAVEGSYPPLTGPHVNMMKDNEDQSGPKDGSFESLARSRLEVLKLQQQMTLQCTLKDVLHAYRELPFVPKASK